MKDVADELCREKVSLLLSKPFSLYSIVHTVKVSFKAPYELKAEKKIHTQKHPTSTSDTHLWNPATLTLPLQMQEIQSNLIQTVQYARVRSPPPPHSIWPDVPFKFNI